MNLDIMKYRVFGKANSKDVDWIKIFNMSKALPAKSKVRMAFVNAVEWGYDSLATFKLKNLDDSMEYILTFDNHKKLWNVLLAEVENPNGLDQTVDPIEKIKILKDELVAKIVERLVALFEEIKGTLKHIVIGKIESGEYIDVNETKFEAIMNMLDDYTLMQNLKARKFIK